MRYNFPFSPDSPYAHIVELITSNVAERGVVLDLGCGHAAIAAPLVDAGFQYVGCDADRSTVDHLRSSGLADAHLVDLTDVAALAGRLDQLIAGRRVVAVTALDVLEHLSNPDEVLTALHAWMSTCGAEYLGVSVPNVAHVDLASKLLTGRWDITPTGLLDETHLRFFTERSLTSLMSQVGFSPAAQHDLRMIFSDQAWPPDHPTQSPDSMLGRFLRTIREQSDENAEVNQFVRLYSRSVSDQRRNGKPTLAVQPQISRRTPFLSVITRTTGTRETLLDTLTCLAAQTDDDFEVLLMINSGDQNAIASVRAMVARFSDRFQQKVRCYEIPERHRVKPLNQGIEAALGRYVAVLDDDDLVLGGWVAAFRAGSEGHAGAVIRCRAADQRVVSFGPNATALASSGFTLPYRATYELASHLIGGQTPQGSVCFPMEALETFGLRFDESMEVCEDLHFLLRVASICGVVDVNSIEMIYRRWEATHSSMHTVAPEVWERAIQRVVEELDRGPLLMPAGTATRLYQAAVQERQVHLLSQGSEALLRRAETGERIWSSLSHQFAELEGAYRRLEADRDAWQQRAQVAGSPSVARRALRFGRRLLR